MVPEVLKLFLPLTAYPYIGEIASCPVCGFEESSRVAMLDRNFKRLPTVRCEKCGLLFTNPLPTESELSRYYTKSYRLHYHLATTEPRPRHVRKAMKVAKRRADRVCELLHTAARTLDVGCGRGEFVGLMLERGYDAFGLEPGESYGSFARQEFGHRIQVTSWQSAEFEGLFDLVTCFHVLEHLREPISALRRIADWLRPGGLAFVEVPDLGDTHRNKGFGAFHFAHIVGFNHHNFMLAAGRAGLQPVEIVAPTAIIFRRGPAPDERQLTADGLELSTRLYGNGGAYRRYMHHLLGRLAAIGRT
jgi:SAM-dependent methyltransferase